jgi:hypothetical protein
MYRLYIAPYKLGSESAKALAERLDVNRISGEKRLRFRNIIINWGKDYLVPDLTLQVINRAEAVANAKNKLHTLEILSTESVSCPEFTEDKEVALQWLNDDNIVYARRTLTGQSGQGIVILTADDTYDVPYAPLYTKGIPKTHEYRVHVAFGKVIDFSKKRRRNETEASPYIKNLDNGWVFCRDDVKLPYPVLTSSLEAVAALGLDFGAVDILYKQSDNKAYVLEVNTAPGLEGTTLDRYVDAFQTYLGDMYDETYKTKSSIQRKATYYSGQSYWNRV